MSAGTELGIQWQTRAKKAMGMKYEHRKQGKNYGTRKTQHNTRFREFQERKGKKKRDDVEYGRRVETMINEV